MLHFFTGNSDGSNVDDGVIMDAAGNLYSLTLSGGQYTSGTAYALTNSNGTWTEQVLYSFTGGLDGGFPSAGLAIDKNGNLFGTAFNGGSNGFGTVFELTPSNGIWTETVLYTFTGGNDGALPLSTLLLKGTHLLGTTVEGGTAQVGVVFEVPYP
ncbi:MAG TPA: choice-of-anchor tandem repeat GloVer-containing protein [Terriglobales bacterium]|nr:choice-of-anchor tandem repeat GloVer-containing protein [Terriglobales bacterium]